MKLLSSHPPENTSSSLEAQRVFIQHIIERGTLKSFQILYQAKDNPDLDPQIREFIKERLMLADARGDGPNTEGDRERRRPDKRRAPRPNRYRKKAAESTTNSSN